ncbi:ClpP/crotonase-like domain-containing protein [Hysterangium stoloniferum]|nr:ClpP/crotonase-like domain-containing protein [Hysterangium stoloniferum]
MNAVAIHITDSIATITLNRPESYNALTAQDYDDFGEALRVIDKREDVLVTIWQATGEYFCSGTDVARTSKAQNPSETERQFFIQQVTRSNTDVTHALYTHSKILVAALNGPVLAFLGQFDFIYALTHAWLAVPFSYLGLISEAGSSVTFVERLGLPLANEVLLFGKKLTAGDLERSGFINKVFPDQSIESFQASVRTHLLEELRGLDPRALLTTKALIKAGRRERNAPETVNLRESYAQAAQFATKVPQKRFMQLATKQIRHKL